MRKKNTNWFVLSLLTAFVAASTLGCPSDDDPPEDDVGVVDDVDEDVDDVDPTEDPEGEMSFEYDNDISGTFSVTGNPEFDQDGEPIFDTFALAMLETDEEEDDSLIIGGSEALDATNADIFLIMVPDYEGEERTFNFEPDCPEQQEPDCAAGLFLRNIEFDAMSEGNWIADAEDAYVLTDGAVEIATYPTDPDPDTFDAVIGTFQGTAALFEENGNGEPPTTTITDGDFEVPLYVQ